MTAAGTLARVDAGDVIDRFTLPESLEATGPPESRGVPRDQVRLMVSSADAISHHRFDDLPELLDPGDLLVVNNSATLPAAVVVDPDRVVHFSTTLPGGLHVVEVRRLSGAVSLPYPGVQPGTIALPGDGLLELLAPYPVDSANGRLWVAQARLNRPVPEYLRAWGRPIRYRHISGAYSLEAYQTVFATIPGSAEMPSAARPFSERLVAELVASGVAITPITLHTGVSSLETGEPPYPEWYQVPEGTAARIDQTRSTGGRVIAVGTTVVRALETTADTRGRSHPGGGWTDLVVGPDHRPRVVDGLITGWHEPQSTHLDLLEAIAGRDRLADSYRTALDTGYLWHEFGDSHLILPG